MTKHIAVLSALLLAAFLAGCSTGTTEQGTLYSVNAARELETYLPTQLDTVHQAAVAAVQHDLGYTMSHEALDAREGIVEGKTARDRSVRVETYKQGDRVTKVEVYVAGDEVAARQLLNRIEARALGEPVK